MLGHQKGAPNLLPTHYNSILQQKGISGSIPDFANLIATPKRERGGGGDVAEKRMSGSQNIFQVV